MAVTFKSNLTYNIMKLSFSFTRKQIFEILIFALIVGVSLFAMSCNGADFN